MVIVDASVAFKWYVIEPDTVAAWAINDGPDPVVAPDLVIAEVCNAAWKAHRNGDLSAAQHAQIAEDIARAFDRLDPLGPLASRASAIARELEHPVYDCFYLTLSELHDAPLVTADRRLLAKVAGTSFATRTTELSKYGR